jgi:hypothetical protein
MSKSLGPTSPTEHDLKVLWGRSAARCAYPDCRAELATDSREILRNQTAHIVSPQANGPRHDSQFPADQLHRYDNLIVMCTAHHTEIDSPNGAGFTPTQLHDFKTRHEKWVAGRLASGSAWSGDISQLEYINLPRLAILGATQGVEAPLDAGAGQPLHDLGFDLLYVLSASEKVLAELNIHAQPLVEDGSPPELGTFVAVSGTFRTKNMPSPAKLARFVLKGRFEVDPHVYRRLASYRFVMPLNPRWVTTMTAFHDFHRGQVQLAGIAQVKHIEPRLVLATPLVLGVPTNPLMDAIFGRASRSPAEDG